MDTVLHVKYDSITDCDIIHINSTGGVPQDFIVNVRLSVKIVPLPKTVKLTLL